MSKEEKKAIKLAKKEAKAEKAIQKAQAKAAKKHQKDYDKFVKDAEKKNSKAQASGKAFVPIAIPAVDEFKSKAEIKAEKQMQKAYAKYVNKIEKKNAKTEAKCMKKGKPFVPIAIPTEEEFAMSSAAENKTGKIILAIILVLLIWFLIYFMIMYINYEYKAHEEPVTEVSETVQAEYPSYTNPHKITTTPDYSIADAKRFLQQVLSDNWIDLGYSSDPSSNAISYNNKIVTVNGADCYVFSASGKTYAVSIKLSACYYAHNGEYTPITFNNTNILF